MLRRSFGSLTPAWREMERLRREMDQLFSTVGSGLNVAPCYPAMNVWANQDGALITAELPGVRPEDIEISVVSDTLTLSGQRQPEELEEGDTYHRRERACGSFSRTFQLPFPVAADQVEAAFDKGVLRVTLPRLEEDKPRKITVKAG
jgi:HSP20 family protein